ncbi:protein kinase [Herbivorax sp. ANBcel31]|uniref:protein kinase domain-containing protein n=1 Tax=Herbivorax sp. ANBcel31 TaxID=3069754 RepID=UPI0027B60751|nr:protein kinase [Herbivorax sp. ANBcel31]MDQ2086864.1 protein kinase [Herbivorax sp. ANBcel31]
MDYIGSIINEKYKIVELYGEGGSSFVYKALDAETKQFVAVKLMKDKITTRYIEDVIRFKKEVHIISRLNHPNIIEVYDMGDHEGVPYIVTEFLNGQSLDELLRREKKFSIDESIQIFKQLTKALEYVHSKSIIHRDVKPGNIFVENGKNDINIKLLDFGVSNILELGEINGQDEVVGTFGYMSPEATGILNRRVDERSDLYSLGVVFYAMMTGTPPFRGKDVNKILHQQLALLPEELCKIREDVPYSLSGVIMKLLLKDPDLRYQSAAGLLFDLERIIEGNYTFKPGDRDFKVKLTYNTRITGRETELKIAQKLLDSARNGNSKMLLVAGESGSGKTSFVDEISKNVYENNGVFLKSRCLDQKNKIPYQIFKELINEYISYIERMESKEFDAEIKRLREIVEPFGEIFITLNPSMKKYLGKVQKLNSLDPQRENQRLLMVLAKFFIKLPFKSEVVLFLDDLQWTDEGSLNLLDEILRRMGNEKLFIVGTYRKDEVSLGHGLLDLKAEAKERKYPLDEIQLNSLGFEKLNTLVANILGEKKKNVEKLTSFIQTKTRGNPFFSINLLRELVEKGAVFRDKDSWNFDKNKLDSISVSGNMIEAILKRINQLTKKQIDILTKAAVVGREVKISVLYSICDIDIDDFIEMIDKFISLQLLEKVKGKRSVLFVHDRIRETFYQMIGDEEKRIIHKSIAKVIEKEGADNKENVLFELVHHYVEACDEEKMRQYLIPAADKAKIAYANEEAVKYYIMGAELIKKEDTGNKEWIGCYSKLVDVYLTMGKNNEAIELLEEIIQFLPKKIDKARIYKKIARAYFKKGNWDESEENFIKSLYLLGERIPKSRVEWEVNFVIEILIHLYRSTFGGVFSKNPNKPLKEEDVERISSYLGLNWLYVLIDNNKLKCIILRMLNIAEAKLPKTEYLGNSLGGYAVVLASLPMFKRSMKYQKKAIKLREEIGEKWGMAQSFQFLGYLYSWKGEHDNSIKAFQKSIDMFSEVGDMWELGMVLNGVGYGYRYTSRYSDGIEANGRYLDISKKIKNKYGLMSAYIELAFCFLESGNFDEAEINLKNALELNIEDRDYYLYCCTLICKGYMEFERGDYDKAVKTLEKAKIVEENNSFIKEYTINVYPYLAEALIRKSEKRYSKGKLSEKELKNLMYFAKKAVKKTKSWVNHYGGALRCLAKAYFFAGKKQKARKILMKSILHTKRIDRRYETAKGLYELAMMYNLSGLETKANNMFKTANKIFKDIGAVHYVKKCFSYIETKDEYETHNSMSSMRLNMERKLSTILNTSRYLSSILDLDELMEKIMDSVLEHVGAERGILFLYPEEGNQKLEAFVSRNVSKEEIGAESFKISRSVIKKVEDEKVPLIVSDALLDQKFNTQESVIINKIRSVMCTPIMAKGKMLGVIYLDNSLIGNLFSGEELEVLDLIACQAGVSVENARLYNKLKISSKEIEKSRDEIKMWNETLEQRVIKRTEELEIMSNKHKALADELNVKNSELRKMIEKLKEHAQTVEELAITKERNRFAVDVHDTLGHSMVLLIKLLEVCKMEMMNNPSKAKARLTEAINTAREGMKELKRSIYGLVPEKLEVNKFITAIEKLVEEFKTSGSDVKLSIDGIYDYRNPVYSYTLYKVCQEAMTNSVRHGKAKNIHIDIRFKDGKIKLKISDDGEGCKKIKKGFGINGMEQRIKELDGKVRFDTGHNDGFKINLELPLEV